MPEALYIRPTGDNVEQTPLPSVTTLVGREAIQDRLIRGPLQVEIERGVNLETCLMHAVRSKLAFDFPPHFLDKPRRHAVRRRLDVQPQGCGPGLFGLRRGDRSVLKHRVDYGV